MHLIAICLISLLKTQYTQQSYVQSWHYGANAYNNNPLNDNTYNPYNHYEQQYQQSWYTPKQYNTPQSNTMHTSYPYSYNTNHFANYPFTTSTTTIGNQKYSAYPYAAAEMQTYWPFYNNEYQYPNYYQQAMPFNTNYNYNYNPTWPYPNQPRDQSFYIPGSTPLHYIEEQTPVGYESSISEVTGNQEENINLSDESYSDETEEYQNDEQISVVTQVIPKSAVSKELNNKISTNAQNFRTDIESAAADATVATPTYFNSSPSKIVDSFNKNKLLPQLSKVVTASSALLKKFANFKFVKNQPVRHYKDVSEEPTTTENIEQTTEMMLTLSQDKYLPDSMKIAISLANMQKMLQLSETKTTSNQENTKSMAAKRTTSKEAEQLPEPAVVPTSEEQPTIILASKTKSTKDSDNKESKQPAEITVVSTSKKQLTEKDMWKINPEMFNIKETEQPKESKSEVLPTTISAIETKSTEENFKSKEIIDISDTKKSAEVTAVTASEKKLTNKAKKMFVINETKQQNRKEPTFVATTEVQPNIDIAAETKSTEEHFIWKEIGEISDDEESEQPVEVTVVPASEKKLTEEDIMWKKIGEIFNFEETEPLKRNEPIHVTTSEAQSTIVVSSTEPTSIEESFIWERKKAKLESKKSVQPIKQIITPISEEKSTKEHIALKNIKEVFSLDPRRLPEEYEAIKAYNDKLEMFNDNIIEKFHDNKLKSSQLKIHKNSRIIFPDSRQYDY